MTSDGEIWLGDLARSLRTLEPTAPDTYAAIARLLGLHLTWLERAMEESARGADPTDAVAPLSDGTVVAEERRQAAPSMIDTSADIAVVLPPTQTQTPQPRTDWRRVEPLESFSDRHVAPRLPFEPLFEDRTAPALVAGLAATPSAIGPFDVPTMVTETAQGRPLRDLPRLPRWSLSLGVQLLIDMSPYMEPFARDEVELTRTITDVVGAERVEQFGFYGCPTRGVLNGMDDTPRAYPAPMPHVPVIVLGDLGVGYLAENAGRGRPSEWLTFLTLLRTRHSHLIVVSPYSEARWPEALRAAAIFIAWDRSTTVSRVLNVIRTRARGSR